MAKKETNPIGFQVAATSADTTTSGTTINTPELPRHFGTIKEIHDYEYDAELDTLFLWVEGFSYEDLRIGIKGSTLKELQLIYRMETSAYAYTEYKMKN